MAGRAPFFSSLAAVLGFPKRREIPSDRGGQVTEWLLRELEEGEYPSRERPFEFIPHLREQATYERILKDNLAKLNISVPKNEIYRTPSWYQDPFNVPAERELALYTSIRQLNLQYYRNKDYFRCIVTSFWGNSIASVFEKTAASRAFIQISFHPDRDYADKYERKVEMFAVIMARLPLVEGEIGTITDIFGFILADYSGSVVSSIESKKRSFRDDSANAAECVVIRHRGTSSEAKVINVWGDELLFY
ncbi:hypothetical protein GGS26DRAFT_604899 [Hypomontagnella submonticulosa]|nr:hypothetical protein GGS26DRAFT_604899 [Hypomontagnella submonticulosa]